MEIKLGSIVETLVEKEEIEFGDQIIRLKKGLRGTVCDTEHIKDGWVYVEFNDETILKNGSGVYAYDTSELKIL